MTAQKSFDGTKLASFSLSIVVLVCCTFVQTSVALQCSNSRKQNSYLWRVEANPPVYLYGTLHVPYKKIWNDIPNNVKSVFSETKSLLVELSLNDEDTLQSLSKCRYLPKNTTINDVLTRKMVDRINQYLLQIQTLFPTWLFGNKTHSKYEQHQSIQLFNAMLGGYNRLRPIWLLMFLSSLSEENIKERNIPLLDTFMDTAANNMGKKVQAMENYKEQCRPFNKLNDTQVVVALKKLLDYLEPLAKDENGPISTIDSNVETYHCGDFLNLVQTSSVLPLPSLSKMSNLTTWEADILTGINKYLLSKIVLRRNRRMTKKICSILSQPRNGTYLFAMGAGHFIGTKSIVHMLQKKNYKVTRVSADQYISGSQLPDDVIELGDPTLKPHVIQITGEGPTVATQPTQSTFFPTLSPKTIAEILNRIKNNTPSTIYKVDSVEVDPVNSLSPSPSPSPSLLLSPSPSPSQSLSQTSPQQPTSNGITLNTRVIHNTELVRDTQSTSSSIKWLISSKLLLTSLLCALIVILQL